MNNFDSLRSKSIDDFAKWLVEHVTMDCSPAMKWFGEEYCKKCDYVMCTYTDTGKKASFAYCEVNNRCKYFLNLENAPDYLEITKMWLELKETTDADM